MQGPQTLQPIDKYIGNITMPVEIYRGIITRILPDGVTLAEGNKSRDFAIPKYRINPYFEISDINNIKSTEPKIGDKVVALYLVKISSKENFVVRVNIKSSNETETN